jgi:hypothetical protein
MAGSSGSDGDWVEVSAGSYHTCGIKTDGALFCWGEFAFFFCVCVGGWGGGMGIWEEGWGGP